MNEGRAGFLRRHLPHVVFAVGMLALALGISLSAWLLFAARAERARLAQIEAARTGELETLARTLEQALGLSQEEAAELARRLQAAAEEARAAVPTGGAGTQEQVGVGDSVEFEIRDASGQPKHQGSGR